MNSLWPATARLCGARAVPRHHALGRAFSLPPLARCYHIRRAGNASLSLGLSPTRTALNCQPKSLWSNELRSPGRGFATERIVAHYDELPPNYTDARGLAFRSAPISRRELLEIFHGLPIDVANANRALQILHGRRVAGTLADPSLSRVSLSLSRDPSVIKALEERAIEWLRSEVNVDEVECAGLRADEELKQLLGEDPAAIEAENIAKAEKLGLYKKPKRDDEPDTREHIYGPSGLDDIRRMKTQEWEEKQARKKAEEAAQTVLNPKTGELETIAPKKSVELRARGEHPLFKKFLERSHVLPDSPPEMSVFQRVWPSGLVTLLVVAGSIVFATLYTPPQPQNRLYPDIPPAAATIFGLIGINAAILLAWRVPALWRGLNKYFLCVPGYPRAMSIVGNVFSHQALSHFFVNMVMLWMMGTRLHDDVGRGNFLAIFMSAGALGAFASLSHYAIMRNFTTSSLGASGAISGVVGAYLWMHRDEGFKAFDLPPEPYSGVPGWLILSVVMGGEMFYVIRGRSAAKKVDYWAHMGGYLTGIAAGEVLRRQRQEKKRRELERRKNMSMVERIKDWSS